MDLSTDESEADSVTVEVGSDSEVHHSYVYNKSLYVAAIEFGTAYCSLAYTLSADNVQEPFIQPLDGPKSRVPTAILIDMNANEVAGFGLRAQEKFCRLPESQQKRYIYFEGRKMTMYHTGVSLLELQQMTI